MPSNTVFFPAPKYSSIASPRPCFQRDMLRINGTESPTLAQQQQKTKQGGWRYFIPHHMMDTPNEAQFYHNHFNL